MHTVLAVPNDLMLIKGHLFGDFFFPYSLGFPFLCDKIFSCSVRFVLLFIVQ